jgi:hypothetical protein
MDKDILIDNITLFFMDIDDIINQFNEIEGENVYRQDVKTHITNCSRKWFDEFSKTLTMFNVEQEIIEKYDSIFDELLRLSLKVSRKNTYLNNLKIVKVNWGEEILIPIYKYSPPIFSITQLPNILESVTEEERKYLIEAIGCAERKYYRASLILGWCAAIYRIQKVIEKLGFDQFNQKSETMKNITTGRYKRFNKKFSIETFNDFQSQVFDNDLIWVLDYWGLIDSNQSGRLFLCYEMRNNSAHPGEAEITPENLASYYSDLKTIVFDNPNFSL